MCWRAARACWHTFLLKTDLSTAPVANFVDILWMFACVQAFDLTKCVFGLTMVKKGVWLNNIVSEGAAPTD